MFNIYSRIVTVHGVYQGIIKHHDDKSKQTIDGESMITFTPNTIDICNCKFIIKNSLNAKLGIVFHTKYTAKNTRQIP